jgi:hypothetical protein
MPSRSGSMSALASLSGGLTVTNVRLRESCESGSMGCFWTIRQIDERVNSTQSRLSRTAAFGHAYASCHLEGAGVGSEVMRQNREH